ncbi:MAG TPA: hypothetical protein VNG13_08165, partial [Mycobacteriales bacterium]|nr:hypothetical protein [Mycobacteriales bacterium]
MPKISETVDSPPFGVAPACRGTVREPALQRVPIPADMACVAEDYRGALGRLPPALGVPFRSLGWVAFGLLMA